MLYVTITAQFNAIHRLFNPFLCEAENNSIYGGCNKFYDHGHNYKLDVTVKEMGDPKTGYVFDLKLLDQIFQTYITSKVDHKRLNF